MNPAEYELVIYQGSTYGRTFTPSGFNLDDYTKVRMQIRKKPTTDSVIWNSEIDGGLSKTSSAITLLIPASLTKDFNFKEAGYDMELEKADGTVDKILYGTVTLVKEYTRELSA